MSIRIRPLEVEVPNNNPFDNDLLDREPAIRVLSEWLGDIEGPCVVALDSEWGGGKSTFLRMWAAHLKKEGYAVAEFNAWETDFSGDPFVALSSHLEQHFKTGLPQDDAQRAKQFTTAAKRVALKAMPALIRIATSGIVDSGVAGKEIGEQIALFAENRLEEFQEGQRSIEEFRKVLAEGALAISGQHQGRPLFCMIDELDRCRPSYAVELLEVAKHVFSVDRIVFVLAINRSQLVHAVKALYGAEFDADGYLHRFFDLDYRLLTPDRRILVSKWIRAANLDSCFSALINDPLLGIPILTVELLALSDLDHRRVVQTLHRLPLVSVSGDQPRPAFAAAAAVTLILRAMNAELFSGLRDGTMMDADIVDRVYRQGNLKELKFTPEGNLLEAMIAVACVELSGTSFEHSRLISGHRSTLKNLRSLIDEAHRSGSIRDFSDSEKRQFRRAKEVLDTVDDLRELYSEGMGFRLAARRVELLPND